MAGSTARFRPRTAPLRRPPRRRIASYPAAATAAAKTTVDASALPLETGLATENELVCGVFVMPETARRTLAVLAAGAQTRDGERDLEALIAAAPWTGD
jgi:hypothetical protein